MKENNVFTEEQIKVFESNGFKVMNKKPLDFIQYTPYGYPWIICCYKTVEFFIEYAEAYNINEAFEYQVKRIMESQDKNIDYGELYKDQVWKKTIFDNIVKELRALNK